MNVKKGLVVVTALMLVTLMLTAPVFADGEEHGEEGEHHFNWLGFFGKLFNSTVLFGGLIFLLRKPLIKLLAQKSLDVKNDIIQREELLKTTAGQLDAIKKRLEKIEEEVQDMKKSAEKSGEEEQQRIRELGDSEARRIAAITEEEIDNKIDTSVRRLKERIADLTIEHFKKDIRTHMDKKTHEKIIEKNIDISGDIIERG
jgi:F0F1-type ATP synthase membrane subunit b/b'